MRTTRGRIIVFILAALLGILFQKLTKNLIFFDTKIENIIALLLYSIFFIFIVIDSYWAIVDKNLYHFFSCFKYICLLISVVFILYLLSNFSWISLIVSVVGFIISIFISIIFYRLSHKYNTYPCAYED